MQRVPDMTTSSSIVTTRPDGQRPALHKRGATAGFYIRDDQVDRVLDTKILHIGGVGLMDAMDKGRNAELLAEAKERGITTTLDVFASTPEDFPLIRPLLAHTDFFMPSEEEAMALSGLTDYEQIAAFLLDQGVGAVILTLGAEGAMYRDRSGTKIDLPSFQIDVVCTCGCGDCFNAGFATGLALGRSIEDCIWFGQASSAQNAMGLGSQAVITSLEDTISFMENTPKRRPKR
jgi:sugar/nucleoside kinase (ribokinase family)